MPERRDQQRTGDKPRTSGVKAELGYCRLGLPLGTTEGESCCSGFQNQQLVFGGVKPREKTAGSGRGHPGSFSEPAGAARPQGTTWHNRQLKLTRLTRSFWKRQSNVPRLSPAPEQWEAGQLSRESLCPNEGTSNAQATSLEPAA